MSREFVKLNCSTSIGVSFGFKFCEVKMGFSQQLEDFWIYLNEENDTLRIPLVYIVIPMCAVTIVLFFLCCYFCLRACQEPELRFVPRSLPTMPMRRSTADIIRMPETVQPRLSIEITSSDEEHSCTYVELDANTVNQQNAIYMQRNYCVRT